MKVIFMGTADFSVRILKDLLKSRHEIVGVVCQPDKKGNRNKLIESEVSVYANEKGLKLYKFEKISRDGVEDLKMLNADIMVTAAYGQMLSNEILSIAQYGVINVHGSLLPKYRGASPVQSAIKDGARETGVTIMQTVKNMDEGDILDYEKVTISKNMTADELFIKLTEIGAPLLIKVLDNIEEGKKNPIKQNKIKYNSENKTCCKSSYCSKIKRNDEQIDWNKTAQQIHNQIRALSSNPAARTSLNGKIFKIFCSEINNRIDNNIAGKVLEANKNGIIIGCGKGSIKVTECCLEGGKRMSYRDFVNGKKIKSGDMLGGER
ncbi:MAG: methionyl-tRNA formyltransferase [Clostridia bacterium]